MIRRAELSRRGRQTFRRRGAGAERGRRCAGILRSRNRPVAAGSQAVNSLRPVGSASAPTSRTSEADNKRGTCAQDISCDGSGFCSLVLAGQPGRGRSRPSRGSLARSAIRMAVRSRSDGDGDVVGHRRAANRGDRRAGPLHHHQPAAWHLHRRAPNCPGSASKQDVSVGLGDERPSMRTSRSPASPNR